MKTVTVKDLVIGTGAPKIIVSLMAKDIASVKSEALAYREADFDILEWRVDHYADLSNVESVMAAAKILRETMPEKPLLFTFRSAKEGGEQAISTEAYIALNRAAIDSGLVDMIDLELFTGDDQVKETVAYAHAHDVKVVMSNHDFHKTPEAEEIIARLRKMQSFDADIPKIALMPQSPDDLTSHAIVRYTPHLGVHPLGFEVASVNGVQWFKSGGMLTVNSSENYLTAGLAGLGIIQIPRIAVREALRAGRLIEVLPGYRAEPLSLSLVYPQRRELSRRVNLFMQWLAGVMKEYLD